MGWRDRVPACFGDEDLIFASHSTDVISLNTRALTSCEAEDIDGLTAWIDNYCRRNPLHAITQATHELIKELRGR